MQTYSFSWSTVLSGNSSYLLLSVLFKSLESRFPQPPLHSKSGNSAMKLSEDIFHYFDLTYFGLEYSICTIPQSTHRICCDFPLLASLSRIAAALPRDATAITGVG